MRVEHKGVVTSRARYSCEVGVVNRETFDNGIPLCDWHFEALGTQSYDSLHPITESHSTIGTFDVASDQPIEVILW